MSSHAPTASAAAKAGLTMGALGVVFGVIALVIGLVIGLGIYSGAYVSEVVRGAIQSIDKGQMEAARSIGMSSGLAMRTVVLPQAVRRRNAAKTQQPLPRKDTDTLMAR